MCGISGYSGKAKGHNVDKLKILIWDNETRGAHSSGVFGKQLYKDATPAHDFIKDVNFGNAVTAYEVIMHTRFATHGARTKENAHPFHYGKIYGVHNGVISNYRDTAKEHGIPEPQVDSEIVYSLLAHKEYDFKTISEHIGSLALAWVQDDKLHLYRRNNPLFIGRLNDGLYFSSRKEGLEMITCRDIAELESEKVFIYHRGKEVEVVELPAPKSYATTFQRSSYAKEKCVINVRVVSLPNYKPLSDVTVTIDDDPFVDKEKSSGFGYANFYQTASGKRVISVSHPDWVNKDGKPVGYNSGPVEFKNGNSYRFTFKVDPAGKLESRFALECLYDAEIKGAPKHLEVSPELAKKPIPDMATMMKLLYAGYDIFAEAEEKKKTSPHQGTQPRNQMVLWNQNGVTPTENTSVVDGGGNSSEDDDEEFEDLDVNIDTSKFSGDSLYRLQILKLRYDYLDESIQDIEATIEHGNHSEELKRTYKKQLDHLENELESVYNEMRFEIELSKSETID